MEIMGVRDVTAKGMESWPMPNYDDPPTRAGLFVGIEIPFAVLMTLAVTLRFYIRGYVRHVLGWDDWIMLLAWALTLPQTVLMCVTTRYGFGRHMWDVRPGSIAKILPLNTAYEKLFYLGAAATKISICITYLRIFSHRPSNLWFCRIAIGYCIAWCASILIAQTVGENSCPQANSSGDTVDWNFIGCVNQEALVIAAAALNSASDFVIFLWPIRFLRDIQLPLDQRVGLIWLFCVGCLICVAGIIRMWYFKVWFASTDIYWTGVWVYILPAIETNLGIVCGCLPACRPVLRKMIPHHVHFPKVSRSAHNHAVVDGNSNTSRTQYPRSDERQQSRSCMWWSSCERHTTLKQEDEIAITMGDLEEHGRIDEERDLSMGREISGESAGAAAAFEEHRTEHT